MKIRNTRGDIPVTLLVIGVFVVCALAMISFINAERTSEKTFIGVQIMEKVNIDIEKGNLDHHYVEDVRTVVVPDWSFNWIRKKLVFSVEYNP